MSVRIKCLIEYDGTAYAGFQIQPNSLSIQGVLETALADILGHSVRILPASRTDAGVHAYGQVIAFDTDAAIPIERICRAVNDRLPSDIRMVRTEAATAGFHPRYDAKSKHYEYLIYRQLEGAAFWHHRAWIYSLPLDLNRMQEAAARLTGTHDMSCFCAAGSAVKDHVRTIQECYWQADGPIWRLSVIGNGFVYHQVRNMVGTMVEIGRGYRDPEYIDFLFAGRDRSQAGPTAPAAGLYLNKVIY